MSLDRKLFPLNSTQAKMRMLGFRVSGLITGVSQISTVGCLAAAGLNNSYFIIYSALNATKFAPWLNVAGAGVAPVVAGATLIEVAVGALDTDAQVAAAIKAAMDLVAASAAAFTITRVNEVLTFTYLTDGATTAVADGAAATGFAFATPTAGVTSAISLLEGNFDATLTEGSAADGDYLLTFSKPFLRTPMAMGSPLTSNSELVISSVSATAVRVKAFAGNDGVTAKNVDFHLIVIGNDYPDQR